MQMNRLGEQLAEFIDSCAHSVARDYYWKIPDAPPCKFDRGTDDLMNANIRLRRALAAQWHNQPADRRAIEQWYVSTWGGVRRNSSMKLERYAASSNEQLIANGKNGVASWSKILALRNPDVFAIYGARVGAALHALQLVNGEIVAVFPHVASRNKVIKAFQQTHKKAAKPHTVLGPDAYRAYLLLLRSVSDKRGLPSLDVCEMCLFTNAEDLASLAAGK